MNDYSTYEAEDFVLDDSFRRWVKNPVGESDIFWRTWVANHPEKSKEVNLAKKLVLQLADQPNFITDTQINAEVERIQLLATGTVTPKTKVRLLGMTYPVWGRIAASFLIIMASVAGFWQWQKSQSTPQVVSYETLVKEVEQELTEQANKSQQPIIITLEDGSRLTLNPRSKVSYPKRFAANQREVYITGEVFFEITRNPNRPFRVYAHGLVTQVLGTSFWVRAPEDQTKVTVSVRTGKVAVIPLSVWQKAEKKAVQRVQNILLTPNQEAIFGRADESLTRTLVEAPALLPQVAEKQNFIFDNTPVAEVFTQLEKSYGVPIEFNAESLKHCTLTVPMGEEPLFEKLDVICKTIGATYQVVDTRIVITSSKEACE